MKTHEITTSKGVFVVVDGVGEDFAMDLTHMILNDEWFIKLSEATEEDAKLVVDESIHTGLFAYYVEDIPVNTFCYKSALDSLHYLLTSKGIDINNGNWYLFKKI